MAAPWEKYAAPSPSMASGVLGTIPGRVDPMKVEDQAFQREQNERARQAEARAEADAAYRRDRDRIQDARAEAKTTPANDKVVAKRANLESLVEQINRVQSLYEQSLAGKGIGAITEYLPTPANKQFDAAAAGLAEQGLSAFRVPGVGAQSDTELRQFIAANKPSASDYDETIQEKLRQLRTRVDATRDSMGLPPAKWEGLTAPTTNEPVPFNDFQKQLSSIFEDKSKSPEQRLQAAAALAKRAGRDINPDDAAAAAKAGGGRIVDTEGALGQFGTQAGQIIAGGVEGLAMLPDALAKTAGQVMALPADALGFDSAAAQLRNPYTVERGVKAVVPEREDTLSQVNRFGGQMVGGVLGFPQRAAQAVTNRFLGGGPPPLPMGNALAGPTAMQAAERQNIQLMPADVGGPLTRRMTAGAAQSPYGAGPVIAGAERSVGSARAARDRLAVETGRVLPEDEAGEAVRRGGKEYIKQVTERGHRWYERAHKQAEGVKVDATNAIRVIDENIAIKSQAGEMTDDVVGELEKVKRSLAQPGGITPVGLREARTQLGSMARGDKLRGTDAKRIFGDVLNAASEDMAAALRAAGKPEAARTFARADKLWRERIVEIDEVLEPVIGKGKSGEDIVGAVEGMARGKRGGVARLQRMLATLPPEERADITATIVSRMGTTGDNSFSPAAFVTLWSGKGGLSGKGKTALFGNGELRRALDDLAEASGAMKAAGKYANTSNTAGANVSNLTTAGIGGAAVALFTGNPLIAAALTTPVIAQRITGNLMASPKFVRWLAKTPKDRSGLQQHIARLDVIAAQNPAISNDVLSLQQRIIESLANPGRLAAEENVTDVGPQPPQ